jgi:hypothetical protein
MKSAIVFILLGLNASLGITTAGILLWCSLRDAGRSRAMITASVMWATLVAAVPVSLIWILINYKR